jgi:hypothetical protein
MPELRERGYRVVYSRVLTNPIEAIKTSVKATVAGPVPKEASLHDFLSAALATAAGAEATFTGGWVLFLDQFEELFTSQIDASARSEFLEALGELYTDTALDLKIVIGIREDHLAELSALKPQIPEIFFNIYRLKPLGAEQARQAIVGPAALYDFRYEDGLVDRLLYDLGGESVDPPQIQIVCDSLYEALGANEKVITTCHYEQLGGACTILTGYLDEVLKQYVDAQRAVIRNLLKAFITSDETKTLLTVEALAQRAGLPVGQARALLDELHRFVDRRARTRPASRPRDAGAGPDQVETLRPVVTSRRTGSHRRSPRCPGN